jgi:hypothetical protein
MSQRVSDMSPSAIDVLMLGIQIMLVAGEGTMETIGCFWNLATNEPAYGCIKILSRKSTIVVSQHFKHFHKA